MTMRWRIAAAGMALPLAVAWMLGAAVMGPPAASARPELGRVTNLARARQDGESARKPTPVYYGAVACSNKNCHGGEQPRTWVAGRELISRCNEALTWAEHDRHADAWKVLEGKRGKQMAKILGYDVTKAKECLTCHATYVEDKESLKASAENHFSVQEGVTCVSCHGAYEDWVSAHSVMVAARKFRKLSPEQKEREYGMANLRDPMRQAELCVSCHVGNIAQGKFVTHEMYAAGHPPLPSFEIGTFVEQQPRHWQYLTEKSPALQKELGLRQGELEKSQLVVMGSLVSFRDSMRLLVSQAQTARTTTDNDKKILDLSNFDCWSCHHGIRTPSWRQDRGYKGTPGRPPWRSWPAEMVPLALEHIAVADEKADVAELRKEFEQKLAKLEAAFDARVYGNPALIEKAANDLDAWSDATIRKARSAYVTAASAKSLLAKVPTLYPKPGNDYDSARNLSWAFGAIYDDVHGPRGGDLKVRMAYAKLGKELKLKLPQGRGGIEDDLDQSLDAIKKYDPKTFRSLFGDLGTALRGK